MNMEIKKTNGVKSGADNSGKTLWKTLFPIWEQEAGPEDEELISAGRESLLINLGIAASSCRYAEREGKLLNELGESGLVTLVNFYDTLVEVEEAVDPELPDDLESMADFLTLLAAALVRASFEGMDALIMYLNMNYMVLQILAGEWFE